MNEKSPPYLSKHYYNPVPLRTEIFSEVVSLSSKGDILASAHFRDDARKGAAQIFKIINGYWEPISPEFLGVDEGLHFGNDICLSGDSKTVAIAGDGTDEVPGRVKVYRHVNNKDWIQLGPDFIGDLKAHFGSAVSLSECGNILAIGERINSHGGSVEVYKYEQQWVKVGNKILAPERASDFGVSISLSICGKIIAVGANAFLSKGVGQVIVYSLVQSQWKQLGQALVGAINTNFGTAVAISNQGETIVIGSPSALDCKGIVNIFKFNGFEWVNKGSPIQGHHSNAFLGNAVDISADGTLVLIGSSGYDNSKGAAFTYFYQNGDWELMQDKLLGSIENKFFGISVSMSSCGKIRSSANHRLKNSHLVYPMTASTENNVILDNEIAY